MINIKDLFVSFSCCMTYCALFCLLFFTGCISTVDKQNSDNWQKPKVTVTDVAEYLKLPAPRTIQVSIVGSAEASVARLIVEGQTKVRWMPSDSEYALIPIEAYRIAMEDTHDIITTLGIWYLQEAFDCDDYAVAVSSCIKLILVRRLGLVDYAVPIGFMHTLQKQMWANVPGGDAYAHALCWFLPLMDNGDTQVHVMEPQPPGKIVIWEKYPNRESVYLISGA